MSQFLVRNLIKASLRLLGISRPSPQELADSLEALNLMTNSWNTQYNLVYANDTIDYTLVIGQSSYTIGNTTPASDINTPNPVRVTSINIANGNWDFTLNQLGADQYGILHGLDTYSGVPTDYYISKEAPASTITFWPAPDQAYDVVLNVWKQIPEYELDDECDLPSAYLQAIKFNLAIEISPEFGVSPLQMVVKEATSSLRRVISSNTIDKPVREGLPMDLMTKTSGWII